MPIKLLRNIFFTTF